MLADHAALISRARAHQVNSISRKCELDPMHNAARREAIDAEPLDLVWSVYDRLCICDNDMARLYPRFRASERLILLLP